MAHNFKTQTVRLVLAAALSLLALQAQPVSATPRLKERAPPLQVATAQGEILDLEALRGKVVLVLFWATWCAPCLEEFPVIGDFHAKHRAEGFEVVALSIDKPRKRSQMIALLSKLPFPGALLSEATENGFGTPDAVPVSYLVDAHGVIRDTFINVDADLLNETVPPLLREARHASFAEREAR